MVNNLWIRKCILKYFLFWELENGIFGVSEDGYKRLKWNMFICVFKCYCCVYYYSVWVFCWEIFFFFNDDKFRNM